MSTIIAEFYAGPRDGEERALPTLLDIVESRQYDPLAHLLAGPLGQTYTPTAVAYKLARDINGDPVKNTAGRYIYEYVKPEADK